MMNFPLELSMITSGRGTYTSYVSRYDISKNQDAEIEYIGADPRNETTFVINDMKASMEPLDKTLMKKKVVLNLQDSKKKKNMALKGKVKTYEDL